jgi:protein TonB
MLLGLLFALFVVYEGIEYKAKYEVADLGDGSAEEELEEEIPITQQEIEEIKPPPPPPPPAPEIIEVVEDDKIIFYYMMAKRENFYHGCFVLIW